MQISQLLEKCMHTPIREKYVLDMRQTSWRSELGPKNKNT